VASANLMARAMDVSDAPQTDRASYETDPDPSKTELMAAAFRDHLRHLSRLPGVLKYTADGVGRVRRSSRKLSPSLTRPFNPPQTFINHVITPQRRFATASLALSDVKEVRKQLGVTINDLVLAMSAGALRRLLLKYDGTADSPLLVSVPVSLDRDPNRVSGNKFTGILVALPTNVCYPLERVEQVHLAAASAKENHNLLGPELVARWSSYIPPAPAEAIFQRAARSERRSTLLNLTVSNVAGPRERGRVAGAVVREIYSVGPLTAGSGMNITVWSYVDQLNISVLTDYATLDDPHEVTEAMLEEFAEIRRAAGLSDTLTELDTAMPQASTVVS
jgi:diacylglycerol O-acyltransferase / wax synthase